jgi:hypothetical protein
MGSFTTSCMDQDTLQALIKETEALGWDDSANLVALAPATAPPKGFAFIGKLLGKPQNYNQVRATLFGSWNFAAPMTMEVLDQNKFLFTVSHENHYKNILNKGPWNIRNSLLLLNSWSPALSIDEVKLNLCAFWIQIHGLPLQYMTTLNAIRIGKKLGNILELETDNTDELICRQFIRLKVEIDTTKPLASGFNLDCGDEQRRISILYERLDDYCSSCGLIGHKSGFCPSPSSSVTPEKYRKTLRAPPYVPPRLISNLQPDESDSGISSAASVGNSPRSVVPSRMLEAHGSVHGSTFNQFDLALSCSKVFHSQHVELPCPLVQSQPDGFNNFWNPPPSTGQLIAAGTYPFQNFTNTSLTHFPIINTLSDSPQPYQLAKYHPPPVHTTAALSLSTDSHSTNNIPSPLPFSDYHSHSSLLAHLSKPNLYNTYLNSWAQSKDNPIFLTQPPSFQINPPTAQPHQLKTISNTPAETKPATPSSCLSLPPSHVKPVPASTNTILPAKLQYHKTSHKATTHSNSRFSPYSTNRPPSSMGFFPQQDMPLPSPPPLIPEPITSIHPVEHHTYCNFPSWPQTQRKHAAVPSSGEPYTPPSSPPSTVSYTLPAIISKSKGKHKMNFDDDEVPLALLKRQRLSSTEYTSPLSDTEAAAISLTNLQHAYPIRGPVYDFLNSPLLGTPVRPSAFKFPDASQCFPGHHNLHLQSQLLSKSGRRTRPSSPTSRGQQQGPPDSTYASLIAAPPVPSCASHEAAPSAHAATSAPSSTSSGGDFMASPVAATKISPSRRFIRANRGRRNYSTTSAGTPTMPAGHIINQEECRVRPPPNA